MRTLRNTLLLSSLFVHLASRGATIEVSYNLAPPDAQAAIDHAAGIWESILVSSVPINVLVTWAPLGTTTLGITFPNGRKDFPGAPLDSTWYVTALANSIAGAELNPGENDFEIFLNSSMDWYYGTDGNVGTGEYDLVSVALHEMGHGFGFVGLCKKTGSEGSFGLLQPTDFFPLFTTFPWPQLDTLPSVFDRHLVNNANASLTDLANPSNALGTALANNNVRFSGPMSDAANGGVHARIYAPSPFALGSSCVHLNESTYPVGNANELMTPFSSAGTANHWPGPVCIGVLQDIGWTIAPDAGVEEQFPSAALRVFPNPATDHISLTGARFPEVVLTDAQGRIMRQVEREEVIDVHDLPPGAYAIHDQRTGHFAHFVKI